MIRTASVLVVALALSLTAGVGANAAGSSHVHAAAPHPLPPVATGTLRIEGTLRDGAWVRAAGLSWRPSKIPHGDRLLSFEVGYAWFRCGPSRCRRAADRTATPFAAMHYVVGHGDTRRRLRLVETATQVVETDPSTFSFVVLRSHRTVTTSEQVSPYPAGRRPSIQFLNGLPEWVTASNAENFQVTAPHHNAADGPTRVSYRFDGRRWHAMPGNRVFGVRHLHPGAHTVDVRVRNRAGTFRRRFGWRVHALPPPAPCDAPCWAPPHLASDGRPMRWDWQIGRVTPLERTGARAVDIYDVDGFLTTPAELDAIHTRWQAATLPHPRAFCYIDLAWEDYRPDATPGDVFPARALGRVYYGYPEERWVDFRQLHALRPMLEARISMCAEKGFDSVEFDDIDSFDPPSTTGFSLTPGDAQNYLAFADNLAHRMGMSVLWKNSPLLSSWGRRYSDGAVLEECYPYRQCTSKQLAGTSAYGIHCTLLSGPRPCGWDDFTTLGKWVGDAEYVEDHYVCAPSASCAGRHSYSRFCYSVYGRPNGFAAVRFDVDLDGRVFQPCPTGR